MAPDRNRPLDLEMRAIRVLDALGMWAPPGRSSTITWLGETRHPEVRIDLAAFVAKFEPMCFRHVLSVHDNGWGIEHPLRCRPNLTACAVRQAAARYFETFITDPPGSFTGRFEVTVIGDHLAIGGPVQDDPR